MIFREALLSDIDQIMVVRFSVKENQLSNPALVTEGDCEMYLTELGKGWVCELDGIVVGFSIVDLINNNIWALFVKPEHEAIGIGKKLHSLMLNWYFNQTEKKVWLGTSPNTRAENFYRMQGWKEVGIHGLNEIKFEMAKSIWLSQIDAK